MNQYFLEVQVLINGPHASILAIVEFPGFEFLVAAPSWFSRVRV
jgi:hypothetical protein